MTGDRICILTAYFKKARLNWRVLKSDNARELQKLMAGTDEINPNDLKDGAPCPLTESNKNSLAENLANENKFS